MSITLSYEIKLLKSIKPLQTILKLYNPDNELAIRIDLRFVQQQSELRKELLTLQPKLKDSLLTYEIEVLQYILDEGYYASKPSK